MSKLKRNLRTGKRHLQKNRKKGKGSPGTAADPTVSVLGGKKSNSPDNQNFAEDDVPKISSFNNGIVGNSVPQKKLKGTSKPSLKSTETKVERVERVRRQKIENDSKHRFIKDKYVKRVQIPMGFKSIPWLPTDTEDASMTISEESTDHENETMAELEENDILKMARHGITYQELANKQKARPYNTHLIFVNQNGKENIHSDSNTTPEEELTEDSRNREESIISELADFIHVQDHLEELMKRPTNGPSTIKKGEIARDTYFQDKPKTIGRNNYAKATQSDQANKLESMRAANSMAGFLVSDQLFGEIGNLMNKNILYPEDLHGQEIGSLPSESEIKLKEEATDPDIVKTLEGYLWDREAIYKTVARHQNIYSSDEEGSPSKWKEGLNEYDYIQNKSLLIHQLSVRHRGDNRLDFTPQSNSDDQIKSSTDLSRSHQNHTNTILPSFLHEEETLESRAIMQAFDVDKTGLFKAQKRDARTNLEKYRIYKEGKFLPDPVLRDNTQQMVTNKSEGSYHLSMSRSLQEDTTLDPTIVYLGNMNDSQQQEVQLKEQQYIKELQRKKVGLNRVRQLLTKEEILGLPNNNPSAAASKAMDSFNITDVPLKEEPSIKDREYPEKSNGKLKDREKLQKYRLYANGEFEPDPDFIPAPKKQDSTNLSVNFDKLGESDLKFAEVVLREDDSIYHRAIDPQTKKVIPVLTPNNQKEFKDDLKSYNLAYFEPEIEPHISFVDESKSNPKQCNIPQEEESLNATYHLIKNASGDDMKIIKQQQDKFREGMKKYKIDILGVVHNNIKLDFTNNDPEGDDDGQFKSSKLLDSKMPSNMQQEESSAENTYLHIRKYEVSDTEAYRTKTRQLKESLEGVGLVLNTIDPVPKPPPDMEDLNDSHSKLLKQGNHLKEDSSMDTTYIMKNMAGESDMYTFKKSQMKMKQDLGKHNIAFIPGEFVNPAANGFDLSKAEILMPNEVNRSALSEELSHLGIKEEKSIHDEMQLMKHLKINDLYQVRGRVAKYMQDLKEYELHTVEIPSTPAHIPRRKLDSALMNKSLDDSGLYKQGIKEESSIENTFLMMKQKGLRDVTKLHKMRDQFESEMDRYDIGYFKLPQKETIPKKIEFSESRILDMHEPREESSLESQLIMKQIGVADKFQMKFKQADYKEMLLANQVYFIDGTYFNEKHQDLSYEFKSVDLPQPLDEEPTQQSTERKKANRTPADDMAVIAVGKELEKYKVSKLANNQQNNSWSIADFLEFHNYKRNLRVWRNREQDILRKDEREKYIRDHENKSRSAETSSMRNDTSYGAAGRPFTKPDRLIPKPDDSKVQNSRMKLSRTDDKSQSDQGSVKVLPLGIGLPEQTGNLRSNGEKQAGQDTAGARSAEKHKQAGVDQTGGFFKITKAPANESFEYNEYREVVDPHNKDQRVNKLAHLGLNSMKSSSVEQRPIVVTKPPVLEEDLAVRDEPVTAQPKPYIRALWSLHDEFAAKQRQVLNKFKAKVSGKKELDRNSLRGHDTTEKIYRDTPLQRMVVKIRKGALHGQLGVVPEEEEDLDGIGTTIRRDFKEPKPNDLLQPTRESNKQTKFEHHQEFGLGDDFGKGAEGSRELGINFDESSIGPGLKYNGRIEDDEGKSILQESLFADFLKEKVEPKPQRNKSRKQPEFTELQIPKLNQAEFDHFNEDKLLTSKKHRELSFIPVAVVKPLSKQDRSNSEDPSSIPLIYANQITCDKTEGKQVKGVDLESAAARNWAKNRSVKTKKKDDQYNPVKDNWQQQTELRPNIYVKRNRGIDESRIGATDLSQTVMIQDSKHDDDEFDLHSEIRKNVFGKLDS